MSTLEILSGKRQGDTIELGEAELDIGNKRGAALSIRDPWVSFKHGRIGFQNGKHFVEDLGSTNGTWINGKRLKKNDPKTLQNGDLLSFGKTKTRFQELVSASGPTAEPASADVQALSEERDELKRMKEVLEKFLDVNEDQRAGIIEATTRPDALVDASAVEAQEARVRELEGQLKAAQDAQSKAEEGVIAAKRAAEDAQSAVKKANEEKAGLEKQIAELGEKVVSNDSASASDKEKAQTLEAELSALKDQMAALERKLEDAELTAKQSAEALDAAKSEAASGGDTSGLEVELKHLQERIVQKDKALEEANNSAGQQRQELMAKNVELENKLGTLIKKSDQQEGYISDLQAGGKKDVEKATEALQKEVRAKSRALEDAQRAQKTSEERAKELSVQLLASQAQGGGSETKELEEATATIAKLQEAAQAGGGGDAALKIQVDQLRKELDRANADREEAIQEMQEVREEIDELSMENIKLEETLEKLEGKA
jgi:pSer/pThr/pTyr-binding forkhead associated (FHA) protein